MDSADELVQRVNEQGGKMPTSSIFINKEVVCQDALFETRKLVGEKLKACIRSKRVTKVNICKKAKISRPRLEEFLNGEIDNKSVFDEHLYKILDSLKITPDFLMKALPETQQPDEMCLQAVFENYQMSEKAMREYELLQDILNLCSIYYQMKWRKIGLSLENEAHSVKWTMKKSSAKLKATCFLKKNEMGAKRLKQNDLL